MAIGYTTLERNHHHEIDVDEYINRCTLKHMRIARALIKTLNIPEITLQIEVRQILYLLWLNRDLHFS
jgi:hypothetical protein